MNIDVAQLLDVAEVNVDVARLYILVCGFQFLHNIMLNIFSEYI